MENLKRDIADKTIINLVGPSAVGKTSLIQEIDQGYADFSRVISYTTRPPRSGEDPDAYRFINASEVDTKKLTENSVQFDQFPGTDIIYGTMANDYRNRYNALDTLSSSVETFRNLGFKACKQFIIVASPIEWHNRIGLRKFNEEQKIARYEEAVKSLDWAIKEGNKVKWIYNQSGAISRAARFIVDLSLDDDAYKAYQDYTPREIGQDLLRYIKHLKNNTANERSLIHNPS